MSLIPAVDGVSTLSRPYHEGPCHLKRPDSGSVPYS